MSVNVPEPGALQFLPRGEMFQTIMENACSNPSKKFKERVDGHEVREYRIELHCMVFIIHGYFELLDGTPFRTLMFETEEN